MKLENSSAEGLKRGQARFGTPLKNDVPSVDESLGNAAHPSKRECPECDFVGYPLDVIEHLKRRHGKNDDEAHDLVEAPQ